MDLNISQLVAQFLPPQYQAYFFVAMFILWAVFTEAAPFFANKKYNGVVHFFYLAFKDLNVDKTTQQVEFKIPDDQMQEIKEHVGALLKPEAKSPAAQPIQSPAPPGVAAIITREGGFITMKTLSFLLAACAMALLVGCAGETAMSTTAKGLLSGRFATIGLAQSTDTLCSKGVLKQVDCNAAQDAYNKAQVAYKTGSDALLAWIVTGIDSDNTAQSSLATVNSLVGNMQTVVNTFVAPQGGK